MAKDIVQVFGSGPKFAITCGACSTTFNQPIPMVDDPCLFMCPICGAVNVLALKVTQAGGTG